MEENVEGCGGKNFRFWCRTILEKYYFEYDIIVVRQSKSETRWRKDGGRFMGVWREKFCTNSIQPLILKKNIGHVYLEDGNRQRYLHRYCHHVQAYLTAYFSCIRFYSLFFIRFSFFLILFISLYQYLLLLHCTYSIFLVQ